MVAAHPRQSEPRGRRPAGPVGWPGHRGCPALVPLRAMGRSLAHLTTRDIGEIHEHHLRKSDAAALRKAGIATIGDLLLHTPRRYLDRSQIFDIAAVPLG